MEILEKHRKCYFFFLFQSFVTRLILILIQRFTKRHVTLTTPFWHFIPFFNQRFVKWFLPKINCKPSPIVKATHLFYTKSNASPPETANGSRDEGEGEDGEETGAHPCKQKSIGMGGAGQRPPSGVKGRGFGCYTDAAAPTETERKNRKRGGDESDTGRTRVGHKVEPSRPRVQNSRTLSSIVSKSSGLWTGSKVQSQNKGRGPTTWTWFHTQNQSPFRVKGGLFTEQHDTFELVGGLVWTGFDWLKPHESSSLERLWPCGSSSSSGRSNALIFTPFHHSLYFVPWPRTRQNQRTGRIYTNTGSGSWGPPTQAHVGDNALLH